MYLASDTNFGNAPILVVTAIMLLGLWTLAAVGQDKQDSRAPEF